MYRFVKVYAYNQYYSNWFLWLTKEEFYKMSEQDLSIFQKNMLTQLLKPAKDEFKTPIQERQDIAKFQFALKHHVSQGWQSTFDKYPEDVLLIRQNGSFMSFNHKTDTILDERFRDDLLFPENKPSEILICENDAEPEDWWIQHLNIKFPEKSITTLGNFGSRSQLEIDYYVEHSDIITFTTTFTSLDWFEKLFIALDKTAHKKLYFHCKDEELWGEVLNKYPIMETLATHDLQIVYKSDLI